MSYQKRGEPPGRALHVLFAVIWVIVATWTLFSGFDYYVLSPADRAYSDLHDVFKPAGLVGHGLGIIGTLMIFLGVTGYSARKRMRSLQEMGRLRTWLSVHIFLCTLGPYLVLLHTAFRIGGLISIAFWSMVAVVLSGVFGRYVYTRIPKSAAGQFLSARAVKARRNHLIKSTSAYFSVDEDALRHILRERPVHDAGTHTFGQLILSMRADLRRRHRRRALAEAVAAAGVPSEQVQHVVHKLLDVQELDLQATFSAPFKRLFGYWHVFHLPLATIMALIVIVHIAIAFTFGYFWIT